MSKSKGIAIKFYLEGNPELNQQIKETTESFKTVKTEVEAVSSAYDAADQSTEKLTKVNETLAKSVEIQEKRLDALKQGLTIVKKETGEASYETKKWEQEINRATAELNKTNRQIETNKKAMEEAEQTAEDYESTVKGIDDSLDSLNSELKLTKSAFKENEDASENLSKQTEILKDMIEEQSKKVDTLSQALEKAKSQSGGYGDSSRDLQMKLNEAKTSLNGMKNELESTSNSLRSSYQGFSSNIMSINDLKDAIMNANPVLAGIAGAAMAAAKKIADVTKASAESAAELKKLSDTSGLSVEELQKVEYASARVGVSSDSMVDALQSVAEKMEDVQNGNSEAGDSFHRLRVAIKDSSGELRPAMDVFTDTIDQISRMRDGADKNAVAFDIFGESWKELMPLIENGSEDFKSAMEALEQAGAVLSADKVQTLVELNNAMNETESILGQMGDAFSVGVAEQASPALAELNELMQDTVKYMGELGEIVGTGPMSFLYGFFQGALQPAKDLLEILSKISSQTDELQQKLDRLNPSKIFQVLGQAVGNAAMGPLGSISNIYGALKGQPGFASGTASAPPGTAWVGEQVLNKEQILRAAMEGSASRGSGDVYNITINADLKQLKDVQVLVDSVKRARQVGRARGCRV